MAVPARTAMPLPPLARLARPDVLIRAPATMAAERVAAVAGMPGVSATLPLPASRCTLERPPCTVGVDRADFRS